MLQTTLAIIKPDAVARGLAGEILAAVEAEGLRPVALKMLRLSKAQAQGFYAVHKERPFFDSLTDYMSSGPVVVRLSCGLLSRRMKPASSSCASTRVTLLLLMPMRSGSLSCVMPGSLHSTAMKRY